MPSKEAIELAKQIYTVWEWGLNLSAILIDNVLAKNRLEGAKAMQNVIASCYNSGGGGPWNLDDAFLEYLRALDPQQVINESVK